MERWENTDNLFGKDFAEVVTDEMTRRHGGTEAG